MSAKKDTAPQAPTDDTIVTFEALQRSTDHLELDADGVSLWTPRGEHYALRSWQCDYVDLDYRAIFGALGGFSGRKRRPLDA
jgi:hypothetical protein